jgi:hypothetical protein
MQFQMRMTKRLHKVTQILCGVAAFSFVCPASAGDTVGLPAPTSAAEDAFPARAEALLALCGTKLSNPGFLGRHALAHRNVHGRRRLRCTAST